MGNGPRTFDSQVNMNTTRVEGSHSSPDSMPLSKSDDQLKTDSIMR